MINYINIILPSRNFIEKESYYLNFEGVIQIAKMAVCSPLLTRSDWEILKGIAFFFKEKKLLLSLVPFLILKDLIIKVYDKIIYYQNDLCVLGNNLLKRIREKSQFLKFKNLYLYKFLNFKNLYLYKFLKFKNLYLDANIFNYYRTNILVKHSKFLGTCASIIKKKNNYNFN